MGRFADYLNEDVGSTVQPDAPVQILPEGRQNFRTKQWEPDKPVVAKFSDAGEMTAPQLNRIEDDKLGKGRAALAGGFIRGLSFDFADEIAGAGSAASAALSGEPVVPAYRVGRDEVRRATRETEEWDPSAAGYGMLSGVAATAPLGLGVAVAPKVATAASVPLNASTAPRLLTLGNTARAAGVGGVAGLGASEADLTKGEVGGAAVDTLKGAGVAVGANTVLGLLGKGASAARDWVRTAPERAIKKADDALIDAVTLGSPASQRDALMGQLGMNRDDVLAAIKSRPELESALKRGDRQAAADIVLVAQRNQADRAAQTLSTLDARGEVEVAPIIKKLEEHRDALRKAGSLESNFEADKVQKRIDAISERWIPKAKEPDLEGPELLGRLMKNADAGDKQRAGAKAEEFTQVAREYKLDKVARDDEATLKAADAAIDKVSKERAKVYDQLKVSSDVPLGNISGKLTEWRDELAATMAGSDDVPKVQKMIDNLWAVYGKDGGTGIALDKLRAEITALQSGAFSGSYVDPNKAAQMGRTAVSKLREAMDEHIAKIDASMPPDSEVGKKLAKINKEFSVLIPIRDAAEKRALAGRLEAPEIIAPETRTGKAKPSEIYRLARETGDEDAKRLITGGLYDQVGSPTARELTAMDRQEGLLKGLADPLMHTSRRDASPPTTLRAGVRSITETIKNSGTGGAMAVGGAASLAGSPQVGVPIMLGAVAAKYGKNVADAAERAAVTMEYALRKGAKRQDLAVIGRMAGLPASVASDLVEYVAPRAGALSSIKRKDEQ